MNNPTKFSNRLGVDIGGTFTDIVLETSSKRFSAKVLTDNTNPETAIFKGINEVCLRMRFFVRKIIADGELAENLGTVDEVYAPHNELSSARDRTGRNIKTGYHRRIIVGNFLSLSC